ncbi:IS630 family transposase [Macellibacteroides fermentans]|uniref:IS630 family transposase n=1 Tax=Macellibacteroides fermentans TaxID=879969 RepID=UPI00406C42CC
MARQAAPVSLSGPDRKELEKWVNAHRTPQQVAQRCRIVLAASEGKKDKDIAGDLQINFKTVALWRQRFLREGTDCLWEVAPGRGRKPKLTAEKIENIINTTLQTLPKGATHWSCRTMAEEQGISKATINRIWQSHGLQPHRIKGFKLSRDPKFLEKLTDVVGLYLNPPEKALVLCVDEKSQIQALDRTQPGLPLKKGRCGTMTHDYKRNGTTTLFAALELAQGKVIGQCYARHRHQEFLKFLKHLNTEFPAEMKLHMVLDNYGTHKHPKVKGWLQRHPRFVLHFIPTGSSWLNLIERWFGELTGKRIRRGIFVSVPALIAAIDEYCAAWNENPKPLIWTATVESIVEKLARCRQTLEKIKPGCTVYRARKGKKNNSGRL